MAKFSFCCCCSFPASYIYIYIVCSQYCFTQHCSSKAEWKFVCFCFHLQYNKHIRFFGGCIFCFTSEPMRSVSSQNITCLTKAFFTVWHFVYLSNEFKRLVVLFVYVYICNWPFSWLQFHSSQKVFIWFCFAKQMNGNKLTRATSENFFGENDRIKFMLCSDCFLLCTFRRVHYGREKGNR